MNQTILIIEDNEDLLELEEFHLTNEGYDVIGFLNTKGVEQALEEEDVSLLIVDRNLPNAEGSEFVASLRDKGYDMPVIFVSAKDSDSDIEEGFLRGGDDYLTKPFNMNELVLRAKARVARYLGVATDKIRYKEIVIDETKGEIYLNDELLHLTKLEARVLIYLINNRDRVVSRDELIDEVWQEDVGYKSVTMALSRLKSKIEKNRKYIEAIRGVGYKLC